jgi:hypothetical protein
MHRQQLVGESVWIKRLTEPTSDPARDLGPRLFTLFAGYGIDVFSYNNWRWIGIPILVPFLGCLSGTWIYRFTISFQIDNPETLSKEDSCKTISTISSIAWVHTNLYSLIYAPYIVLCVTVLVSGCWPLNRVLAFICIISYGCCSFTRQKSFPVYPREF